MLDALIWSKEEQFLMLVKNMYWLIEILYIINFDERNVTNLYLIFCYHLCKKKLLDISFHRGFTFLRENHINYGWNYFQ